jgi:hypothetical protein
MCGHQGVESDQAPRNQGHKNVQQRAGRARQRENVLKCALAHIKAGRLSRVTEAYQVPDTATSELGHTNKNSEPTQAMLASWENHKNNKTRRETAITCYHKKKRKHGYARFSQPAQQNKA